VAQNSRQSVASNGGRVMIERSGRITGHSEVGSWCPLAQREFVFCNGAGASCRAVRRMYPNNVFAENDRRMFLTKIRLD
jgi:hypothetical protein